MKLILTVLAIFILLLINELIWRKKKKHSELSRKFIHIVVGSLVAFWPFYLSYTDIRLLSLSFLVVVLISRKINIFKAIHSVQRSTYGEISFALSVGLLTLLTVNKWIYLTAILEMSLADGLAAIIGKSKLKNKTYTIFKHTKSILGTLTFFVISLILLTLYARFNLNSGFDLDFIFIALISALLENVSISGLDNLTIPIFITLMLRFI